MSSKSWKIDELVSFIDKNEVHKAEFFKILNDHFETKFQYANDFWHIYNQIINSNKFQYYLEIASENFGIKNSLNLVFLAKESSYKTTPLTFDGIPTVTLLIRAFLIILEKSIGHRKFLKHTK